MIYTPEDAEFDTLAARSLWFENVLLAEWGEVEPETEIPTALDWLSLLPAGRRLDIEEVDCSLAFVDDSGYVATIWDATGVEDDPWAVFLVDDCGARLLSEYSLFDEEPMDGALDVLLARAAEELPERLESGELSRAELPVPIPEWLMRPVLEYDEED